MNRLKARLKKLEGAAQEPRWNWNFSEVVSCARKKLTQKELLIVDEAYAIGQRRWTETHRAIWERWGEVMGEASDEVGFPVRVSATDLLL